MSSEKQTWRIFSDVIPDVGDAFSIVGDEHHYLSQVLRMRTGETLEVSNGLGLVATVCLQSVEKKGCSATVIARHEHPAPQTWLHLFVGQPKPGALDEAAALAAELGAHHLHIVRTQRTAIKTTPRADRLGRIAIETTRITKSPWVMQIHCHDCLADAIAAHSTTWSEYEQTPEKTLAFLCDESPLYSEELQSHNHLLTALRQSSLSQQGEESKPRRLSLFIGPEASFTVEERERIIKECGARPVSLGNNILRVPTAVASATALSVAYLESL